MDVSYVSNSATSADGSTTLTTAGVAQTLFDGKTPVNGFAIYNCSMTPRGETIWFSDTTTAASGAAGCIFLGPCGTGAYGGGSPDRYQTPVGYKPQGPVSVVGSVNGQKITARMW
jgi:hypothetical protein